MLSASVPVSAPAGRSVLALPERLADLSGYIDVQTSIRQTIFAGAAEASAYYVLDALPVDEVNWTLGGVAYGGVRFQLEVLSAQELNNVSNDPQWIAKGGRASYLLAVMRNMAGDQIDIAGCVFRLPDATGVTRNFLFPMATLGTQVRTQLSTRTLRCSTPASIIAGHPDGARVPGSDPNCEQTTTEQEKCICLAQLGFDECIRNAKANNAICVAACLAAMAAALAYCAIAAVVPGIGWLTSGACALGVIAAAAICVNACTAMYLINGIANCREQFRIAMVPCGIYW